LEVVVEVL
jgi:hypothetical protein